MQFGYKTLHYGVVERDGVPSCAQEVNDTNYLSRKEEAKSSLKGKGLERTVKVEIWEFTWILDRKRKLWTSPVVISVGIIRLSGTENFHPNEAVFSGINYRSACGRLAPCTQAELLVKSGCEWVQWTDGFVNGMLMKVSSYKYVNNVMSRHTGHD